MYFPKPPAGGTLIGDLNSLSDPQLVYASNSPYTLIQTGDSDKVTLTANLLYFSTTALTGSMYSLSISHTSGTLNISLYLVTDRDLYRPYIAPDVVQLSVQETTHIGSTLYSFACKDFKSELDISHSLLLEYYSTDMMGIFNISKYGNLQVSSQLNALDTHFVPLLISCIDPRAPLIEAYAAVTINITSLDASALTCITPISVSLCEDRTDVVLSDITCYHPSYLYSSSLLYSFTDTRFREENSQLLLDAMLNYEESTRVQFQITVSDPADTLLSAVIDVSVDVLPVNEFAPTFELTQYHVQENDVGPPQISLLADDRDHGLHGQFTFQLVSPDSSLPFSLSEDGKLSILQILNHEATSDFTMSVKLTDKQDPAGIGCNGGIKSSTLAIQVQVDDINETPSFVNTPFAFELLETDGIGKFVGRVECSDPDHSFVSNGEITYSLTSSSSFVSIGLTSGSILLQSGLNFTDSSGGNIGVRCIDQGTPSLSDSSVVTVSVKPIIQFEESLYAAELAENAGVGTFVQEVSLILFSHLFDSNSFSFISDPTNGVFAIDSTTGIITLDRPLLIGASGDEYLLTVQATATVRSRDGAVKQAVTNTQLNVSIVDSSYIYFPTTYSRNVSENMQDITLLTIVAINAITNSSDDLFYSLLTPNSNFQLNNETGDLVLISPLDREAQSKLTIPVIAFDFYNTSIRARTDVLIYVLDLNDVTPVCVNSTERYLTGHYYATPHLLTPHLNCTDLDAESPNNNITFSLLVSGFSNLTIDSATGEIFGFGNLTLGLHDLSVVVSDMGAVPGPLSTAITVRLHVTRNNFYPQFRITNLSLSLFENYTLIPITTVLVSDGDVGPPGDVTITYSITPSDDNVFAINATSGLLSLVASLDYERTRQYVINFIATDNGRPQKSNSTTLILNVVNLNDESPFCGALPTFYLDFDNSFPDFLYQLQCSDPDNLTDVLLFSIDNSSNASIYFSISSEGIIQTISSFITLSSHIFPVSLSIPILVGESNSNLVSMLVLNVNLGESGFSFEFDPISPLEIPEDFSPASIVATFTARHAPTTQVSLSIRYTIQSVSEADVFSIDSVSGQLILSEMIDFETVREYTISIRAVDNASYMNIRILSTVITVTDICDNPPVINHAVSTISILQGSYTNISVVIHTFPCSDIDAGNNGAISCSVTSSSPQIDSGDPFFVMSGCDLTLNRKLNRICEPLYTLQINCTDLCDDVSRRTSLSFQFKVQVEFENLERPTALLDDTYPFMLDLNEEPTVPLLIHVSEDNFIDRDCSPFNQTFFKIEHIPSGYLFSDKFEGRIILNKSLDYEKDDPKILRSTVEVFDCEELDTACKDSINSFYVHIINLKDVNDNSPQCILNSTRVTIPETDSPNEEYPTAVLCSDIDTEEDFSMIYFEITPNNSVLMETFEVFSTLHSQVNNTRRLNIRLLQSLDYENTSQYVIQVRAYNKEPSLLYTEPVITLTVDVSNINEHGPFFSSEIITLSLSEDFDISNIVYNSTVIDLDHPPENSVLYQFSANTDEKFQINNITGEITLSSSLDREMASFYQLVVFATETTLPVNNHTATQRINITVNDVNDNSPNLILPASPIEIQQNVSLGEIHTFPCSDSDVGINNTFSCDVTSPVYGSTELFLFSVESPVCKLLVGTGPVPNCSVALSHNLVINCTDRGTPSLSSTFSVTVIINLVNLQDPFVSLNQTQVQFSLPESTLVSSYLVDLSQFVSDGDCQNFGQLTFSIYNQFPNESLYVSLSAQGNMTLARRVDFENPLFGSPPSLVFVILVQDNPGGSPTREAKFNVTFMIQDSNDNPPTCTSNSVTVSIEEGSLSVLNLSTICYDVDSSLFGELNMTLSSDHSTIFLFANSPLNSSHSLVSIAPILALDFEATESYTIQVLLSDSGTPPLSTAISVTVLVVNINDNTPVFTNVPTNLFVAENAAPTLLFTISASDLDKGIFGQLTYSLISAGYNSTATPIDLSIGNTSQFEIGLFSGELIQLTPIDFETDFLFHFGVLVQDLGSPSETAKAYFNVTIENVNEFPPLITAPASGYIRQGAVIGKVAAILNVSDGDTGDNFFCYIHNNSVPNITSALFTLNHTEFGVNIVLDQPVVCNDQLLYQLFIVCNDSVANSLSSSIIFNISILSQNLNVPLVSTNDVHIVIEENQLPNTILFKVHSILFDPDCARNGSYRYSIVSQIPTNHNYLGINPLTGYVFVNGSIDYESGTSVVIAIQVEDLLLTGSKLLPSPILLTTTITDLNDNPPICTANDSFSIPEAIASINISTNIICTDRDSFSNLSAILSDSILSGHFSVQLIQIMDTTFQLVLTVTNLDYETVPSYDLVIIILDLDRPEFNRIVNLFIEVISVNEHAPFVFPSTISMSESEPIGFVVAVVFVIHQDHNESLIFSLTQPYPYAFSLDPSNGTLSLNSSLDFENPDHRNIVLTIVVNDTGVPPMSSGPAYYSIALLDENDNPPTIGYINNQDYFQVFQSQSSGIVANLSCSDPDTEVGNTQFNCSINASTTPMDSFHLVTSDSECVILSVQAPPCVDALVYNLTLNCQDTSDPTLFSSFDFQIHLIPENLTTPFQTSLTFPIFVDHITESQTATNLPVVVNQTKAIHAQIQDSDCGMFGQLLFSVATIGSDNLQYVYVDNKTGLVTIIREVDKETLEFEGGSSRIQILMNVRDNNGEPGFRSLGGDNVIIIDIQDVNDEFPTCNVSNINVTIPEETTVFYEIPGGKITCRDNDSCAVAQLNASSSDPLFSITPKWVNCTEGMTNLGDVEFKMVTFLRYDLESEKKTVREFRIDITDGLHTWFIDVTVNIRDKSEFRVMFQGLPYNLNINYTAFGLLNFSVTAIDLDFTSQIRYASSDLFFSVDSLNGSVSVISPLSSTNQTTFQLNVTATDLTSSDFATDLLNIVVNHPPSFLTPPPMLCVDNTSSITLEYTDNNLNTPGQDNVTFYFLNHTNPPLSFIDTHPKVVLSAVYPDNFSLSDSFLYTLVIEDTTGYTDFISFNVSKCSSRRRRNVPMHLARYERSIIKSLHFSQLVKLLYLPITYPAGLKLPLLSCMTDLSLPISYSLLLANHSNWPFALENVSGEIEVLQPLYRLTYHLVEQCSNSLHKQIVSYVVVVLLDAEYTPVFNESSYDFLVPENTPVQTTVGTVLAETERRHAMTYSSNGVSFDVRTDSGGVFPTSQLDFETMTGYSFTVTAVNVDIHSMSPSNTVSVSITITDVNDNAPEFIDDYTIIIHINEAQNNPIQQVLERVHCMDADLPETNQIEYSLETSNPIFDITPSTGYLYINVNPHMLTLDYSDVFFIRCTDQTHLPNPVFDRALITISPKPHSLFTCDQVYQFNVTWPQTEPNTTARVLCPYSLKVATRVCNWAAEWNHPDMSECSTIDTIPGIDIPVVVPFTNCYPNFISLYLSQLQILTGVITDSYGANLHLAGDLKLSIEYFLAAEKLIFCLPINSSVLHSVAVKILQGLDLLTRGHFSEAWLTLGGAQSAVSSQLVYLLSSLTHRLIAPYANSTQSILSNYHQNIATELHPRPTSSIHSPYLFSATPELTTTIAFSGCYLPSVREELGLSYLNDTSLFILKYLPSHLGPDGKLRSGVSTGYVGVFSSEYSDNGQECAFNLTFTANEGTEDHMCAIWEFNTGYLGSWSPDACLTDVQTGGIECSCKGVGVVGVIGTTPPVLPPYCFPLEDLAAFSLFVFSSVVIFVSIIASLVTLVFLSRKQYKKPLLFFKLHVLLFLLLAETANFIGIFIVPYDSVCHVMSIITHVLFVFVFCWLFMLSILQLLHILMPKKEAVIDKSSITLFFAGYAISLCLIVVSLIDIDLFGVLASPTLSQCKYLYCWVHAQANGFPTSQLISSAVPLMLTQIILGVPIFLHFFAPESKPDTDKSEPSLINTKLSFSQISSQIIPSYLQVYILGLHYSFLSNAYDGAVFGAVSSLFTLLTSAFLLTYYTEIISFLTKKNANHFLKPKFSATDFITVEDYEMRIVTRQHERVNWAFLNVQEDRFYEEGRQLGAHFNIALPNNNGDLKPDNSPLLLP